MMLIFEIIGGFAFFLLLGVLSLFIIPGFFGCLGFILFWFILLSLLIFFSINIGWIILLGIIAYIVMLITGYFRYRKLPDYDTYLATNPNLYRDGVALCKFCNSEKIINRGLVTRSSKFRYYQCLNCRNWLYKYKVI